MSSQFSPTQLAEQVVKMWSSLAPYVIEESKRARRSAGKEVGKHGDERILASLAKLLKPRLQENRDRREVSKNAFREPDATHTVALQDLIQRILEKDPRLLEQVSTNITEYNSFVSHQGGISINGGRADAGGDIVGRDKNIQITIQEGEDFERTLEKYLVELKRATEKPGLFPVPDVSPELEKIYVQQNLRISEWPSGRTLERRVMKGKTGEDQKRAHQHELDKRRPDGQVIPFSQVLASDSVKHLAIIGSAGCGKSTLLNYLAFLLASDAIGSEKQILQIPRNKQNRLIPILIPLRFFRLYHDECAKLQKTKHESPTNDTLIGFIQWCWNFQNGIQPLSPKFFDYLLDRKTCVLMLDGLDEVVSIKERRQIRDETETLARKSAHYIILTARESGYGVDAVFGTTFKRFSLEPLNEKEGIPALVQSWCKIIYPPRDVQNQTQEICDAISRINEESLKNGSTAPISTPLMVTIFVSVWKTDAKVFDNRAQLYEKAVEAILARHYDSSDKAFSELDEWSGEWKLHRECLQIIALEMQSGGINSTTITDSELKRILSLDTIRDYLPEIKFQASTVKPKEKLNAQRKRFVEIVQIRGGLFEKRGDSYQFIHRTFQEFLSARKIGKDREQGFGELKSHIRDPWWREVFLLTYQFLSFDHPETSNLLLAWLKDPHSDPNVRLEALSLAGEMLLEQHSTNTKLQLKKEIADAIARIIESPDSGTSAQSRVRAGNVLAQLGDERRGVGVLNGQVPDLLWCKVPAGAFTMGSSKKDGTQYFDPTADTDELPVQTYREITKAYYITRYPITNAQYELFINDPSGYKNDRWWTPEGVRWRGNKEPERIGGVFDFPNHPVVNVSWFEAHAFTKWLANKLFSNGFELRVWDAKTRDGRVINFSDPDYSIYLPTEAQWEKAARGEDGRRFPWGPDITEDHANYQETKILATSPVGCFPKGASPYGVLDMSGNVYEWCKTLWAAPTPDFASVEDNEPEGGEEYRAMRGGWFHYPEDYTRCAARNSESPAQRHKRIGFRVVLSIYKE